MLKSAIYKTQIIRKNSRAIGLVVLKLAEQLRVYQNKYILFLFIKNGKTTKQELVKE